MVLLPIQAAATGRPGAEERAAAMDADGRSGNEPRPRAGLGIERLPDGVEVERLDGEVLRGDRAIAAVLRSPDLDDTSLEWIQAQEAFIEYAFPHLVAMGTTGRLHAEARHRRVKRLRLVPKDLRLDEHCARVLAHQMIARALRSFRRTALPRWDPDKGANLADYFLGCCVLQLVPAWHALWPTSDDSTPREEVLTPPSDLPDVGGAGDWERDPAETVPSRISVRSFLGRLRSDDPLTAQLIELRDHGYSLTEALDELGEGAALKSRLWRLGRRLEREEDF